MRLLVLGLLLPVMGLALAGSPSRAATIVDFEGLPNFLSPGSAIPGITISPEGGIADEATVALVTGLSFPPGSVATSGTALLGNLFGSTLTITFDEVVMQVSLETVGSLASGMFGTITLDAFAGATLLGSVSSDPLALGDSGAPESLLDLGALTGITSIVLSSDIGGASSFLVDDLRFTVVPEPSTGLLVLFGGVLLSGAGRPGSRRRTDRGGGE